MQLSHTERRPRVLLDVDGVIADFANGFLKLVNAQFGTSYTPADITDFDIGKALGWSAERTEHAYSLITECDMFAARLAVYPSAQDGVARLLDVAEVYAVTSPWWSHPTWVRDRNNWLYANFGIGAGRVVHTAAKHLIAGDVLVDDKTSTCEEWRAAWPVGTAGLSGIAVQWQTPHNRLDAWDGPSTASWDELIDLVQRRAGDMDRWFGRAGGAR